MTFSRLFRLIPALLLVLTSSLVAGAQEVLDGIAAVVNEDVITFSQVRELVGPKEKAVRDQYKGAELVEKVKEVRLQAINDLIDRQLILQEFKKNKYQLPPYVMDERVNTIIREEFGGDRAAFLRTLAAQGYTLDKFKEQQRDVIIVQEMRRMAMKTGTNIVVPEEKIAADYRAHIEEYTSEEQIKLRMIMLKKSGANDARKKMLQEIREKILGGSEFEDLARMYDEDANQEVGGDWGWINRRTLNESLSKIAFSLKPGQMSEIIEMAGSYYLLYVEAKKAATVKPLKEVHDEIEKRLLQQERQKQQGEWLQKLRKKAFIKMY